MGEQIRPEDWLPEGWKVEIRVRKTGKKDRYYTDPVHGYIFRSLKDIDRYLLTGKLGRHVTKTRPKELGSDDVNVNANSLTDVLEKKEMIMSDELKKSCLALAAHKRKLGGSASKRKGTGADNSKEMTKKKATGADNSKEKAKRKIRRPSNGKSSRSSKKRESTPFFILDADKCEDSDAIDIPNLSEIIDSVQREQEGNKTVYVSAPAIGSLLAGKTSGNRTNQDHDKKSRFALNMCRYSSLSPKFPSTPPGFSLKKEDWWSKSLISPFQHPSPLGVYSKMVPENRAKEAMGCSPFGDLLTDPCIDFAIKTLTGTTSFGRDTAVEDCLFQQQLGSSRMKKGGGPCQS